MICVGAVPAVWLLNEHPHWRSARLTLIASEAMPLKRLDREPLRGVMTVVAAIYQDAG